MVLSVLLCCAFFWNESCTHLCIYLDFMQRSIHEFGGQMAWINAQQYYAALQLQTANSWQWLTGKILHPHRQWLHMPMQFACALQHQNNGSKGGIVSLSLFFHYLAICCPHVQCGRLVSFSQCMVSNCSFNDHHAKIRVKIECVYGMWKSKFGVLKCRNVYSPERICKIIQACAYLWNLGIEVGDNIGYNPDDWQPISNDWFNDQQHITLSGQIIRNWVKDYLWANRAGNAVAAQWKTLTLGNITAHNFILNSQNVHCTNKHIK